MPRCHPPPLGAAKTARISAAASSEARRCRLSMDRPARPPRFCGAHRVGRSGRCQRQRRPSHYGDSLRRPAQYGDIRRPAHCGDLRRALLDKGGRRWGRAATALFRYRNERALPAHRPLPPIATSLMRRRCSPRWWRATLPPSPPLSPRPLPRSPSPSQGCTPRVSPLPGPGCCGRCSARRFGCAGQHPGLRDAADRAFKGPQRLVFPVVFLPNLLPAQSSSCSVFFLPSLFPALPAVPAFLGVGSSAVIDRSPALTRQRYRRSRGRRSSASTVSVIGPAMRQRMMPSRSTRKVSGTP